MKPMKPIKKPMNVHMKLMRFDTSSKVRSTIVGECVFPFSSLAKPLGVTTHSFGSPGVIENFYVLHSL